MMFVFQNDLRNYFQKVDARFKELERINDEQQRVIDLLQREDDTVDRLQCEFDELRADVERLQLENGRQQQTIDELKAWQSDHQHDVTSQPTKRGTVIEY